MLKPDRDSRLLLRWGLVLMALPFATIGVDLLLAISTSAEGPGCGPLTGLACLVAPVGLILVLVGAADYISWPNRQASTWPKCRKCGYLLIGLTEARCPECGTSFEPPPG